MGQDHGQLVAAEAEYVVTVADHLSNTDAGILENMVSDIEPVTSPNLRQILDADEKERP